MTELERLARELAKIIDGADDHTDDHGVEYWVAYQEPVRKLLMAIREPTEAMQRAGFLANVHRLPDGRRVTMAADKAWRAIIDEILK